MTRTVRPLPNDRSRARCPDCGRLVAITRAGRLATHYRDKKCPGYKVEVVDGPEPPSVERLACLLHDIKHMLVRVAAGDAQPRPHEQDRIDAMRWLPEIEAELAKLPAPKTRVIAAGALGGADPVEHYYEDHE